MTRIAAVLVLALAGGLAAAHDGPHPHDPAFDAPPSALTAALRPQKLADGSLWVPKSAQHLLGLRTTRVGEAETGSASELLAVVSARPEASLLVGAPQAGRLEPAAGGWPLPGQRVTAGETMAWLRPVLTQRETARRRARLGDLEQKIAIAQLNVDRITLQTEAHQGHVSVGNIYSEQADAELRALQRQRELIAGGLGQRLPLKAAQGGDVVAIAVTPGQLVATGDPIFELADATQFQLVATSFDPRVLTQLRSAQARLTAGTAPVPLRLRSSEPLADAPGWQLRFAAESPGALAALHPGQLLQVAIQHGEASALAAGACVRDVQGHETVWLHIAAERFAARAATGCTADGLQPDDRVVIAGAVLLDQYR